MLAVRLTLGLGFFGFLIFQKHTRYKNPTEKITPAITMFHRSPVRRERVPTLGGDYNM